MAICSITNYQLPCKTYPSPTNPNLTLTLTLTYLTLTYLTLTSSLLCRTFCHISLLIWLFECHIRKIVWRTELRSFKKHRMKDWNVAFIHYIRGLDHPNTALWMPTSIKVPLTPMWTYLGGSLISNSLVTWSRFVRMHSVDTAALITIKIPAKYGVRCPN